jgi:hypothetical protein
VETLGRGGYRIVDLEVPLAEEFHGHPLTGSIDCLAEGKDGAEGIIDFKYSSADRYRKLLESGRAIQLATYAFARAQRTGRFPAVAYLLLTNASLFTPAGSALAGAGSGSILKDAPQISRVWGDLEAALERAGDWLEGRTPVPARPLQDAASWPAGAELVLEKDSDEQSSCRYCDYRALCGLRELR